MTTLRVDVAAVDRTQFKIVEEEGETLVIPLKDKFRWRDDELHLRSLVLDGDGHVISAGFPKFFNFGELPAHDRGLAAAMARGAVELPEKLDGSLIVADRIAGAARLRTRGKRTLGEFAPEVEALVATAYRGLMDFLREDALLEHSSLLFEFVSPDRPIVLRPAEPSLFLLGYVDKRTIAPGWDPVTLARIHAATGVPPAPLHHLPAGLDDALAEIRSWKGREGVVARFVEEDGTARLVKIKAADYLRLHAYRSRLGGNRARKLAWLLDLHDIEVLLPALAKHGLDWEAAEFARADVTPYLAERTAALARFADFVAIVEPWAGTRARDDKRGYVERVRGFLAGEPRFAEGWWFTAAMRLFDAGAEDAQLVIDAAVLDESPASLRMWVKDRDAEVGAILTAPVREEDG